MNTGNRPDANWDWLKNPDTALELYAAERRAFYEWDAAATAWSKATAHLDIENEAMTEQEKEGLQALKERLDKAAQAYDLAKRKLHEEWAA